MNRVIRTATCLLLTILVALVTACAQPNYEMIMAMQQATVQSNERIAQAIASAEHKMVEIRFEDEAYIPAGTTISTWYDWTHAIQFADTRYNPGVETFKAEAQRDAAIVLGVIPSTAAVAGSYLMSRENRKMSEAILKNVGGGVTISAAEDAQVTWTGDVGAREWGMQTGGTNSGANYSPMTDYSMNPVTTTNTPISGSFNPVDNTHDPIVVVP